MPRKGRKAAPGNACFDAKIPEAALQPFRDTRPLSVGLNTQASMHGRPSALLCPYSMCTSACSGWSLRIFSAGKAGRLLSDYRSTTYQTTREAMIGIPMQPDRQADRLKAYGQVI